MNKHFVPEDAAVVASSEIAMPGKSVEVYFTAPSTEGDYPYVCTLPGHAFTMVGTLAVANNTQAALNKLNKSKPTVRAQCPLLVTDKPLLQRAFVQDSPARSICVGLPGGVNYLFDAEFYFHMHFTEVTIKFVLHHLVRPTNQHVFFLRKGLSDYLE